MVISMRVEEAADHAVDLDSLRARGLAYLHERERKTACAMCARVARGSADA